MRKTVNAVGDRLLRMFVPGVEASAACSPYSYIRYCACYVNSAGVLFSRWKYCYVSSSCHTTCDDICGEILLGC